MRDRAALAAPRVSLQPAPPQQEYTIMRDTPVIILEVRFGGSSEPGWHNVSASNNQTYGYRYTGGDDGEGGIVAKVGKGKVSGKVRSVADKRYQIRDCKFNDDPTQQLDFNGSGIAGVIIDKNTETLDAKYTLNVTDTENGNCNIPCDPRIVNQ